MPHFPPQNVALLFWARQDINPGNKTTQQIQALLSYCLQPHKSYEVHRQKGKRDSDRASTSKYITNNLNNVSFWYVTHRKPYSSYRRKIATNQKGRLRLLKVVFRWELCSCNLCYRLQCCSSEASLPDFPYSFYKAIYIRRTTSRVSRKPVRLLANAMTLTISLKELINFLS